MLKVTLTKSGIGYDKTQRATARARGLGKIGSSVLHAVSDSVLGMIRKIRHLLTVENLQDPVEAQK